MEPSSVYDDRRKSSCATIVPPSHSKYNARKASLIPLQINTSGPKSLFYDTGSMTDISPTAVAFNNEEQVQNIQETEGTWVQKLKLKLKLKKSTNNTEKDVDFNNAHSREKQHEHNSQSNRVVRHSYSDPRLSPGSTAVGDDDEEQQGYFSRASRKKAKQTPRGWVAAVLMIVFGALIAVTFVLVGLGKALGGSGNAASIQTNSTITPSSKTLPSSSIAIATSQRSGPLTAIKSLSSNPQGIILIVTKAMTLVHRVTNPTPYVSSSL
ncbi:hypothetical protein [Parasitella parasitica]|uniref:Uncharacterized protein n=1 Tax=Parasitella parasitica TaxID=35722 RepID=A0A0B7NLP4_9FUNG|nr:hypothetical protein [Parasitella parasitica]